jgi:hypothetical protein
MSLRRQDNGLGCVVPTLRMIFPPARTVPGGFPGLNGVDIRPFGPSAITPPSPCRSTGSFYAGPDSHLIRPGGRTYQPPIRGHLASQFVLNFFSFLLDPRCWWSLHEKNIITIEWALKIFHEVSSTLYTAGDRDFQETKLAGGGLGIAHKECRLCLVL